MSLIEWFNGFRQNKRFEFENKELRRELGELKASREKLLNDTAEFRMKHAKILGTYAKKIEERDEKMASFTDEINRLKKLIELNRERNPVSTGTPPVKPPEATEDKKKVPRGKGNDRSAE
jgi:hypothetical protein